MFDFEKLKVYQKAKEFHQKVMQWLKLHPEISKSAASQLERASLSIALNIAEGNTRFSRADKRNFLTIARGSTYECYAIFDLLAVPDRFPSEELTTFKNDAEEISKMLFAMIRNLQ